MKNNLLISLFIAIDLCVCSISGAQEIKLEDQVILYLPMNGNVQDESGQNVPTQSRGPIFTTDRFGNPDRAMEFDGIDDYITINDNNPIVTSKSFTISLWVKIHGQPLVGTWGNAFFEQRDNGLGTPGIKSVLYFRGDYHESVMLHTRSSTDETIKDLKCDYLVDGSWHHYLAKIDENKIMEIYLDGNLFCSSVFPNDGDFHTSIDHVSLGAHHPEGIMHARLYGIMDEVYIYNRALKLCEIEALFSGQLLNER